MYFSHVSLSFQIILEIFLLLGVEIFVHYLKTVDQKKTKVKHSQIKILADRELGKLK